jgi:hypothetical protein
MRGPKQDSQNQPRSLMSEGEEPLFYIELHYFYNNFDELSRVISF